MAPQQDLVKIGQEGFSVLEKFFYLENKTPPRENDVQKPDPKSRNPKKKTVIDSASQADKKYGGVVIIDGQGKYRLRNTAAPAKRAMEP
ncbi:hypothetical protein CDL12_21350 [Handroanthus impetiginosus]|uniref:Uncharacterized protein n=1 Tax=Handroanthus impetiginosus TaxID=429701 RepID=A0A2G9GLC1_9LAMI|nr:hypothetical protein CDL12_21350 [Handroanthus impetiginosus]